MLLAHMLLQLVNSRIALPSSQSVASTAFWASGDTAVIVSHIAMFCRDMAIAVGFTAKGRIAALPGATVAIWADIVGLVSVKEVGRRRLLSHAYSDIHIIADVD